MKKREVVKLDDDGNATEHYVSVKEAAERNGLRITSLCNALQRGGSSGGMKFRYAEPKKSNFKMPDKRKYSAFQSMHLPYGGIYKM